MEHRFPTLDRALPAAAPAAPDFRALVALVAAYQAGLPAARAVSRPESTAPETSDIVAALLALFAPRRGEDWAGTMLRGRFNPCVPLPDGAASFVQPW